MIKNKQSNQIEVIDFIKEAHKHQEGKVCNTCKELKPFSEFNKHKRYNDGLRQECKSCAKEYQDNMCRFKKWFMSKRAGAKQFGTEFTIEPTDIPGVKIRRYKAKNGIWTYETTEYPKVCPVFGIDLDWGMNGRQPNSPSLDRTDNNKDYIPGNVILMSDLANAMKQNATPEQLKQFSRYHLFNVK